MDGAQLKKAQSAVAAAASELAAAKSAQADANLRTQRASLALQAAQRELEQKNRGMVVSEHAMLRFLERVLGADLVFFSALILAQVKPAQTLGDGKYPLKYEGRTVARAVVKNGVVVTVEPV